MEILQGCLNAIYSSKTNFPFEVIVVDNGSKDSISEMVKEYFPAVKLIENEDNLGFCKATNQGIAVSNGDFILLLNNDCFLKEDSLNIMLDVIKKDRTIGALGCRLVYPGKKLQPSCYHFRTLFSTFAEEFFLNRIFPKSPLFSRHPMTYFDHSITREVDWIMGSCILTKKSILDEVGYLDEMSSTGDEELCYRIKEKGYRIIFSPDTEIIHLHRQTAFPSGEKISSKWIAKMTFEFYKSACLSFAHRYKGKKLGFFICIKKTGAISRIIPLWILAFFGNENDPLLYGKIKGFWKIIKTEKKFLKDNILNQKPQILMLGPDFRVKGGISRLVPKYFNSILAESFNLKYLPTHIDGTKIQKFFIAVEAVFKFFLILFQNPPSIIHIHFSSGPSFYRKSVFAFIARLFRIKTVLHCHAFDFDDFYQKSPVVSKRYIEKILKSADRILVLSCFWKNVFGRISGRNDISIIPPALPIPLPDKREKQKNYFKTVLFLGKLEKRKGIYDLIEAAKSILDKTPETKFLFVGNGEIEKVQKICKDKGIETQVICAGWAEENEKSAFLKESDMLVLPSYNEGLPMAILEAMAYGLPVISTRVGGIPEIITEGENGFLIEPGDITALKNSIVSLLDSEKLRKEMGEKNRKKIEESFNINDVSLKIKNEYEKLLNYEKQLK